MKQHVTVVPSDRLIIIDGNALRFDFPVPENMHALQWHDGSGHIEWTDDINHPLTSADYAGDVAPFVDLWEAEKARIEEEAAAAEASRLAEYNSEPARAARIRAERDRRLDATTWLVERHKEQTAGNIETSITGEDYAALLTYRQALRDLPQQEGFPWEGPDDPKCPWPDEIRFVAKKSD
ncbi:phage tail assembly chaperone [Bilophila wadsworthia]|uniref:phage tail assembly chaperone n=1 Tax=Bilophila wadsworthia TaxID=35833 RepID=UPI0034D01452